MYWLVCCELWYNLTVNSQCNVFVVNTGHNWITVYSDCLMDDKHMPPPAPPSRLDIQTLSLLVSLNKPHSDNYPLKIDWIHLHSLAVREIPGIAVTGKGAVIFYGWGVGANVKILRTQNLPPLDNRALHALCFCPPPSKTAHLTGTCLLSASNIENLL